MWIWSGETSTNGGTACALKTAASGNASLLNNLLAIGQRVDPSGFNGDAPAKTIERNRSVPVPFSRNHFCPTVKAQTRLLFKDHPGRRRID
jgi:hypothetical protein